MAKEEFCLLSLWGGQNGMGSWKNWEKTKDEEKKKRQNRIKILTNDEIKYSVAWQQRLIRWFVYPMNNNHLIIMNPFGCHWSIDQYPFCWWYLDRFRPHRIHHRIVIGDFWMIVLTGAGEVFVIFVANNWRCQWYLLFLWYTFWNSSLDLWIVFFLFQLIQNDFVIFFFFYFFFFIAWMDKCTPLFNSSFLWIARYCE